MRRGARLIDCGLMLESVVQLDALKLPPNCLPPNENTNAAGTVPVFAAM